jgi:nucleoside-diphosphate-sugar epimerase
MDQPVILITGGAGRIGRALSAALAPRYRVVALERTCGADVANCVQADIGSQAALGGAMRRVREQFGNRIASVIHLAAFYDFSGKEHPAYRDVNVDGTRHLLHALAEFEVGQFVYASTMLVHAPTQPGVPIDETSELGPKWPYPRSKGLAERVLLDEHGDIPLVILRIAGVYTDQGEVPSLTMQMQRIYEKQWHSHLFPGDPAHGQSFVHLDDLTDALQRTVERRAQLAHCTTLLIGEPVTESYEALQNLIGQQLHGEPWETMSVPKSVAAGGAWMQEKMEVVVPDAIDGGIAPFVKPFMIELADDHYELDISRARSLLGWAPRHRLRDTLRDMTGALKADPAAWYRTNRIAMPPWLQEVAAAAAPAAPAAQLLATHETLARAAHQRNLWCHFANAALGLWMLASPFAFGLSQFWMEPVQPVAPNGRGLALSHTYMTASSVVAGIMIVVLSMLSLGRDKGWARWGVAALGGWLLLAPLLFWTPSAAVYANDTLVGALLILFSVCIPATPGESVVGQLTGPEIPPGWTYNPSGWNQRIPIVALAFVGLFVSRYLAAYQMGHIPGAWDPLFGDDTEQIVTSWLSDAFPVSDAGLGALTYVLEIVLGLAGGRRRWRTMPWLVLVFGAMIVPLGVTSIFFIIVQPVWLGAWCTLCLVAGLAMLIQIPYSFDELLASLQYLRSRMREGKSLLRVLLFGGTCDGDAVDNTDNFDRPARAVLRDILRGGVTFPWTLWLSIAIGAALMCTRLVFGTTGAAADSDHIVGALVITFSIMAWAEVARPLRYVNALFGAWLVFAPWILAGFSVAAAAASVFAGVLLLLLAIPRGAVLDRYGTWDRRVV